MTASTVTPPLAQQLHQALRVLRSPTKLAHSALLESSLVTQRQKTDPTITAPQALRTLLDEYLHKLHEQDAKAADLLRGRFWEGITVDQMMQRDRPEAQSQSRFYQQQEQAISLLAQLWEEQANRVLIIQQNDALLSHLPAATYSDLVGVEPIVRRIVHHLTDPLAPAIVTIKGIGGIGKTATADCVVRRLVRQPHNFGELVWISAKQEFLTPSGITAYRNGSGTQIRLEQLFDDLGEKVGVPEVKQLSLAQKVEQIAKPLRHTPHLVIIDNLETVVDFQGVVSWLGELSAPSRFLLTSREIVPSLARVITVELDELDRTAAVALAAHTAQIKEVVDCDEEAIYELVGGNPLAIILVVSLMHQLPPTQVLSAIRSGEATDLYTYIYRQSWEVITQSAKELLFTIQRAGDAAEWGWLELVSGWSTATLYAAIAELTDFSLLYCQGGSNGERCYTIHRLTSTFLRTEILGWK